MTKDDMDLLKGFPLSIEQKERLLELIGNNTNGGGSDITQNSVDVYYDDETYKPSYIIYDDKRIDILTENEGGFGDVFRVRDTEFYEWFKENKPIYVKTHTMGVVMTTTAIIGYVEGETTTYKIFNATLSVIMPTMATSNYEPSVNIHIEIFPNN